MKKPFNTGHGEIIELEGVTRIRKPKAHSTTVVSVFYGDDLVSLYAPDVESRDRLYTRLMRAVGANTTAEKLDKLLEGVEPETTDGKLEPLYTVHSEHGGRVSLTIDHQTFSLHIPEDCEAGEDYPRWLGKQLHIAMERMLSKARERVICSVPPAVSGPGAYRIDYPHAGVTLLRAGWAARVKPTERYKAGAWSRTLYRNPPEHSPQEEVRPLYYIQNSGGAFGGREQPEDQEREPLEGVGIGKDANAGAEPVLRVGEQQTYNPDDEEKEKEKDSGKVFDRDLPERPRVGDLKVYPELYARAVSCARAFDVMKGKSYRNAVAIALDRLDDAFFWDVTKEGEQFWRSVDSGGSVKSIVDAYPAQAYLFAV